MELYPWHWLVLGMLLMIAEIFVPSFTIFWFGLGALGVSGLLWAIPSISLILQLLLWAIPWRMIPNDNDCLYYPEPTDIIHVDSPTKVLNAGHTALLRLRSHKLNLVSCSKQVFPNTYEQLLMTAMYMCCEGNVMMNFNLFQDQSLLPKGFRLRPQQCSDLFADISQQNRMDFFHYRPRKRCRKGKQSRTM